MDVPEAQLEETEQGLVYKGDGWFVVNAEEVRWRESEGCGRSTNFGGDILFDQIGLGIDVLGPGVGGREGCVVFGVGSRERHTEIGPDGERRGKEGESEYTVDETALKYNAGIEPGTPQNEAYSRFPPRRFVRYGGWLD